MRRQLEEILLTARVFEFFHQIDHDFNNVLLNLFLKNRCMRCQLEEILLIARVFELFLQIDHDFNKVLLNLFLRKKVFQMTNLITAPMP